jgi:hypothetical protein
MSEVEEGQYWRHESQGTSYLIVEVGCAIQCSTLPIVESRALGDWVAYRRADKAGPLIFRPVLEFLDGRFYRVP